MDTLLAHIIVSCVIQSSGTQADSSGLKSVPASLTLGGFDTNRFESHNVSFDLDPGQNPVVALNEISITAAPLATSNASTNWPSDSIKLLDSDIGGLYTIDSSTPYLWLPESVCLQFEKALGLTYDEVLELYMFAGNAAQHEILKDWNMTFSFVLADLPGSSRAVSLSLPYAAFDLQLTYPFPGLNATQNSAPTNYFPLRKAANSTQYTIGRAFLQETYLIVDYARNNFSISQAIFDPNAINNKNLVDISRPKNSTLGGPDTSSAITLSKGAIAGISVAAVVLVAISLCLATVCFRRRRDPRRVSKNGVGRKIANVDRFNKSRFWRRIFAIPEPDQPFEVDGCNRQPNEASSESEIKELPANASSELPGSSVEVPPYEETRRKLSLSIVNAIGYDPKKPVELHSESTPREYLQPDDRSCARRHDVSSIYSPDHVGTQSTGISRSPGVHSESSQLSSPALISPLTPEFGRRTGWMGYTNQTRNHIDGSDGDARFDNPSQGMEYISDNEHDARYPNVERHTFSSEESREEGNNVSQQFKPTNCAFR